MFLSNSLVHAKFGRQAWRYIPETVRPLWKNVVMREFPQVYFGLYDIPAACADVTMEVARFEKVHRELKLVILFLRTRG